MNEFYLVMYKVIFLNAFVSFILALLFVSLSYFLVFQVANREKTSAYECGFDAFEPSRERFEVKFYIVGMLFIIFDLEIVFLIPWSITANYTGFFGLMVVIFFLLILTLGFIYEWINKALDWPR